MDTPVISDLEFRDRNGSTIPAPREWEPAIVLLPIAPDDWANARLTIQGDPSEIGLRLVDGRVRVVSDWPRRGAGQWRCILGDGDRTVMDRTIDVRPAKLDPSSIDRLLDDIDRRLVGSIAMSLDRMGAFAGLIEKPRMPGTVAEEIERLRRALLGDDKEPGLIEALRSIARNPHSVLLRTHAWRSVERARAPVATRLAESMRSAANAAAGPHGPAAIERVWNAESERTVDVFENRLLGFFVAAVARRLRRLSTRTEGSVDEVHRLSATLEASRAEARFLEVVGDLKAAPSAPSMVLIRRSDYRWMYRRWLEFRRSARLITDLEPRSAPMQNLPWLYEIWASLVVVETLVEIAEAFGWRVQRQRLIRHRDGWFVDLNWNGRSIIELTRAPGEWIRISPQRSFPATGRPWRSISFAQVPDLTVEIGRDSGPRQLLLFDPKYKLSSESSRDTDAQIEGNTSAPMSNGRPSKIDIDKMHAYRDAIRSVDGDGGVAFAAILYPGPESEFYERKVAALAARPLSVERIKRELVRCLEPYLGPADP